jgi:hypothetical protein
MRIRNRGKRWLFYPAFFAVLAVSGGAAPVVAFDEDLPSAYPHVALSNGLLEMSVFLPDIDRGFYRSTRFDWTGIPGQITFRGHTYFMKRPFQRPHDPLAPGHGMSLAEEFDIGGNVPVPQRFEEAKPGETFMKIGAGSLEKPADGKPYAFVVPYRLADPGKRSTRHGRNWIEFTHTLRDAHGFGYVYTKRMELRTGRPELVISHSLKNTGKRDISATQYCHNFFILDGERIGKNYRLDLAFIPRFSADLSPSAVVRDSSIVIEREPAQALFAVFEGYGSTPAFNRAVIRNTRTGAGVDIRGDFPLAAFNFFSESYSFCPELFVKIAVAPGKTQHWKRTYTFFAE